MTKKVTKKLLNTFSKNFNSSSQRHLSMNALTRSKLEDVAMKWDCFRVIDHQYSTVISNELKKVTNQKSSGRCWGFAALNLMRLDLAKSFNLEKFEFSQSYFMFYDKLEKSNYFLESILSTLDEPLEGRLISWLVADPIQDGGQWDMFVNLMEKYGIVPQSVMPETTHSSNSRAMNRIITRQLRKNASILRTEHEKGVSIKTLRQLKTEMMEIIFNLLCSFIGHPPSVFDWQVRNKDKKFIRFENLTPLMFYKDHVKSQLSNKVCLIHCPMKNKRFHEVYTIKYLGNVIEGQEIKYINVPIEDLKRYAVKSLKNDEAVWFGCDVGKMFHRDLGVMDTDLYDFETLLGTDPDMDKGTKLEYGDSQMTHAMLFTGVDLKNRVPSKWRVENSWGDKSGDKGYFLMTDDWFSEYMYEVVIDKCYLPSRILSLLEKIPVALDPWDPMGALAS